MAAERRSSNVGTRAWALVFLTIAVLSLAALAAVRAGVEPDKSGIVALAVGSVAMALIYSWFRAAREREDTAALAHARAKKLNVPATLYPVIDPDICIGSLSCLKVCPEGDILGVVDGKAQLINASACIGHGKCYLECPVDAIKLVFGTSVRGLDLPEVNEYFESSRPGVHIIGELGGMGLIKNAMTQGLQLAEHLAERRK